MKRKEAIKQIQSSAIFKKGDKTMFLKDVFKKFKGELTIK